MAPRFLAAILARRRANPATTPAAQLDGAVAELITDSYANITTMADFDAATDRPAKSPALIGAIIDFALRGTFLNFEQTSACMLTLTSERELTGQHLLAMTRALTGRGRRADALMLTICSHPRADASVLAAALWSAGRDSATLVATHTGTLLPGAIGWFRAHRFGHSGFGYPTADERHQIGELTAEWDTWCGGDPARTAFLTHHWSDFANADEMFAAGAALAAAPAGPQ